MGQEIVTEIGDSHYDFALDVGIGNAYIMLWGIRKAMGNPWSQLSLRQSTLQAGGRLSYLYKGTHFAGQAITCGKAEWRKCHTPSRCFEKLRPFE